MYRLIIVFSAVLLLSSCADKENLSERQFRLNMDTLLIQTEFPFLPVYNTGKFHKSASEDFFVGYNSRNHSLDVFDIAKQQALQSVKLEKEGPNGIGNLFDLAILNQSTLALFAFNEIVGYDLTNQEVLWRQRLNVEAESDFFATYYLMPNTIYGNFRFADSNTLYIPLSLRSGRCKPETFENQYLIGAYSLSDKSFEALPIPYHPEARNQLYGFSADEVIITALNDKWLSSFLFAADFSIYDPISKTNRTIEWNPKHAGKFGKAIRWEDCSEGPALILANVTGTRFSQIFYSSEQNLYFRLYSPGVEKLETETYGDLLNRKKSFLAVWDKDFNLLYDSEMDTNFLFSYWYYGQNGVYQGLNFRISEEDTMEIIQFNLSLK